MNLMTLSEIRRAAQNGSVTARVHVQVESASAEMTREQKPFCKLVLADACDRMTLRVWNDHPEYRACEALAAGEFIELFGEFNQHQQFGLEARPNWKVAIADGSGARRVIAGTSRATCETSRGLGIHSRRCRRKSLIRAYAR